MDSFSKQTRYEQTAIVQFRRVACHCPLIARTASSQVLVTDEVSGNAKPLLLQTRARVNALLLPVLERGAVPVITGFFGSSQTGLLTTLGRGGTDLTAAVIGACV
jgi:aspartokinase